MIFTFLNSRDVLLVLPLTILLAASAFFTLINKNVTDQTENTINYKCQLISSTDYRWCIMTSLLLFFFFLLCALRPKHRKCNSRPTRTFNGMTNSERPAHWVHQGTPNVTPKIWGGVVRGLTLVCVHQLQTTTNYRHDAGHSGPTHVLRVHDLHTHADFDRRLHAFSQLGGARENICVRRWKNSLSSQKQKDTLTLPLCRSQQVECWLPPALTSGILSSLGCSDLRLFVHS